jgi:hypothetical protein
VYSSQGADFLQFLPPISLYTPSLNFASLAARTGELIGVVVIHTAVQDFRNRVQESVVYDASDVACVEYTTGYIVSDTLNYSSSNASGPVHVTDTNFSAGDSWNQMKELIAFHEIWEPENASKVFQEFQIDTDDAVLAVFPIPPIPKAFSPYYEPYIFVVHRISRSVYNPVTNASEQFDKDTSVSFGVIVGLGFFGIFVSVGVVWYTSRIITRSLLVMDRISWRIINHAQDSSLQLDEIAPELQRKPTARSHGNRLREWVSLTRCFPRTEIDTLVAEFQLVVKGFSGPRPSRVAAPPFTEIKNSLSWRTDYATLQSHLGLCSNELDPSGTTSHDSRQFFRPIPFSEPNREVLLSNKTTFRKSILLARRSTVRFSGGSAPVVGPLASGHVQHPPEPIRSTRSKLFWRVLFLLVTPLVIVVLGITNEASDPLRKP